MYYILVMTTAGAALDKCHNARVNEGFEAWRQFVMEWEPKLRTRYVGLLMNVLGYRFRDDIPTKLAAFERTVHEYENQSTKTVDDGYQDRSDDAGDGGHASQRAPHPEQRQNHKLESDARGDSRDHANTTVHRQSTNANAARSESEGKQREQREQRQRQSKGKGKGKGKDKGKGKGKTKAKDVKNESSKKVKERRSEKVFLLQQDRSREGRVQKETERPCRGRGEPVVASPHPHTQQRSCHCRRLVNVCHSHALCEQRNVLRVFQ